MEGVIPEDFGWVMMVSRTPFLLWLACRNTDGSTSEWTVYPVAELSVLQCLFNRLDPAPEIERLSAHLAELVPSSECRLGLNAQNPLWSVPNQIAPPWRANDRFARHWLRI